MMKPFLATLCLLICMATASTAPAQGRDDPRLKDLERFLEPWQIEELGLYDEEFSDDYLDYFYSPTFFLRMQEDTAFNRLSLVLQEECPRNPNIRIYIARKKLISEDPVPFFRATPNDKGELDLCDPTFYVPSAIDDAEFDYLFTEGVTRSEVYLSKYKGEKSSENTIFSLIIYRNAHGKISSLSVGERRRVRWFWHRWIVTLSGDQGGEWMRKWIFVYDFSFHKGIWNDG